MNISVIVPVYNESGLVDNKTEYFKALSNNYELIFIDGNSNDDTAFLLKQQGFRVIHSNKSSRGAQLSLGVCYAKHDILLFHHFDGVLPDNANELIISAIKQKNWGRFNVNIDDPALIFRIIETAMNWRSALTGIATGDQAIFVQHDVYIDFVKKLEQMPIMEDIYLSSCLKQAGNPAGVNQAVTISSRYWRKNGILKSILNMWRFRLLYFIGVSPARLYRWYYS